MEKDFLTACFISDYSVLQDEILDAFSNLSSADYKLFRKQVLKQSKGISVPNTFTKAFCDRILKIKAVPAFLMGGSAAVLPRLVPKDLFDKIQNYLLPSSKLSASALLSIFSDIGKLSKTDEEKLRIARITGFAMGAIPFKSEDLKRMMGSEITNGKPAIPADSPLRALFEEEFPKPEDRKGLRPLYKFLLPWGKVDADGNLYTAIPPEPQEDGKPVSLAVQKALVSAYQVGCTVKEDDPTPEQLEHLNPKKREEEERLKKAQETTAKLFLDRLENDAKQEADGLLSLVKRYGSKLEPAVLASLGAEFPQEKPTKHFTVKWARLLLDSPNEGRLMTPIAGTVLEDANRALQDEVHIPGMLQNWETETPDPAKWFSSLLDLCFDPTLESEERRTLVIAGGLVYGRCVLSRMFTTDLEFLFIPQLLESCEDGPEGKKALSELLADLFRFLPGYMVPAYAQKGDHFIIYSETLAQKLGIPVNWSVAPDNPEKFKQDTRAFLEEEKKKLPSGSRKTCPLTCPEIYLDILHEKIAAFKEGRFFPAEERKALEEKRRSVRENRSLNRNPELAKSFVKLLKRLEQLQAGLGIKPEELKAQVADLMEKTGGHPTQEDLWNTAMESNLIPEDTKVRTIEQVEEIFRKADESVEASFKEAENAPGLLQEKAPELPKEKSPEKAAKEAKAPSQKVKKERAAEESRPAAAKTAPAPKAAASEAKPSEPLEEEASEPPEAPKPKIRKDREVYTGLIQKSKGFTNFYPLYEWRSGSPRRMENLRELFPSFGNILLRNVDRLPPPEAKKFSNGAMVNIEFSMSELASDPARKSVLSLDADALCSDGRLWGAEADARDDGFRKGFYAVSPVSPSSEVFTKKKIEVLFGNEKTLPPGFDGLLRTPVLLALDGKYYGPYPLECDSARKLFVDPHKPIYREGLGPWRQNELAPKGEEGLGCVFFPKPLDALNIEFIFSSNAFMRHSRRDFIGADGLAELLVNSAVPQELRTLFKEWYKDASKLSFAAQSGWTPDREKSLRRLLKAFSERADVAEKFRSLIRDEIPGEIKEGTPLYECVMKEALKDLSVLEKLSKSDPVVQEIKRLAERKKTLAKNIADTERKKEALEAEFRALKESVRDLKRDSEWLKEGQSVKESLTALQAEKRTLETEAGTRRNEIDALKKEAAKAQSEIDAFDEKLDRTIEKVAELSFEGIITDKIIERGASLKTLKEDELYKKRVSKLASYTLPHYEKEGLVCELVSRMRTLRPYEPNLIINMLICAAQGFLTIFCGEPGTGKTSVSNYLAQIMGTTSIADKVRASGLWEDPALADRYVSVSVERSWSSKRDLVGYWNPLTKTFECTDPHRFECFRQLDRESRAGFKRLPYFMLLDEANLSPMEYYFADFMNICDERTQFSYITLDGKTRLQIPDTLRFFATVNVDHTTEQISPRLIDRSWIITLPSVQFDEDAARNAEKRFGLISWENFLEVFADEKGSVSYAEAASLMDELTALIEALGHKVSPRTRSMVNRYLKTASLLMEEEKDKTAWQTAADYAALQKLLPVVNGSGEKYRKGLEKLRSFALEKGLGLTAGSLQRILDKGALEMDNFQFF